MLARMRSGGGPAVTVAVLLAGLLLLAAVLAQLILPRIAANRISSRLGRYGKVEHVSVSAWPAVKLLWGDADSVSVRAGGLALSPSEAGALLWESRGLSHMDLSARSVKLGQLQLEGVTLRKRGEQLSGDGSTTATQAGEALPPGVTATLLDSREGQVEVSAGGGLFGISASVRTRAEAREGRLIAHPVGFLLEGFQLTLFADPHVHIEGVGATVTAREPLTYGLSAQALLH
jgi:hypothetical protein